MITDAINCFDQFLKSSLPVYCQWKPQLQAGSQWTMHRKAKKKSYFKCNWSDSSHQRQSSSCKKLISLLLTLHRWSEEAFNWQQCEPKFGHAVWTQGACQMACDSFPQPQTTLCSPVQPAPKQALIFLAEVYAQEIVWLSWHQINEVMFGGCCHPACPSDIPVLKNICLYGETASHLMTKVTLLSPSYSSKRDSITAVGVCVFPISVYFVGVWALKGEMKELLVSQLEA